MSAKIFLKTGMAEGCAAGICMPLWTIRDKSPSVFRTTVLPPVLGPVTTTILNSSPNLISSGVRRCIASRGFICPFFAM